MFADLSVTDKRPSPQPAIHMTKSNQIEASKVKLSVALLQFINDSNLHSKTTTTDFRADVSLSPSHLA